MISANETTKTFINFAMKAVKLFIGQKYIFEVM